MTNENFMFFAASAASIYVLIEIFKKIYPEWTTKEWLIRLMYVIPTIMGIAGMAAYAAATNEFGYVHAVPYGIVAGALSQTLYELVEKAIRQKAGAIVNIDQVEEPPQEEDYGSDFL